MSQSEIADNDSHRENAAIKYHQTGLPLKENNSQYLNIQSTNSNQHHITTEESKSCSENAERAKLQETGATIQVRSNQLIQIAP